MILETKRLYLREMNDGDLDGLRKIMKDKYVMYAYEHIFSDDEIKLWLYKQIKNYKMMGFGLWAVILKENNEMIGQCGLTMQPYKKNQVVEIGYLFQKKYWHQGFASEAASACKQYAFNTLNIEEVYSIIRDSNIASQNVAIRNGMNVIDEMIKHYYQMDMLHYVYSIKNNGGEI